MYKLSIIIVNWNTKDLLRQCLDSVVREIGEIGKTGGMEIIIVDNGSSDGSVEMVQNYKDKNSRQFAKIRDNSCEIRLIENKENLGFAKAVNQALRQVYTERNRSAQGELFLLLNSDTQVKSGALGEFLRFEEKVRPAIIGAKMLNSDGTVQGSCFYLPTIKRAIEQFWLGKRNYFSKYAPVEKDPVEVEAVSGGAMMISRDLVDKIGMFDERYFMYFEDLDFCRRARKAGYKIYYLAAAEIMHEHGASGKDLLSSDDQWKRLIPSSRIYYGLVRYWIITFILWSGQKCLNKRKT